MLVLTRKTQEQIHIGHNITVTVVRVKGHSVRLGIEAPGNVRIVRGELAAAIAEFRDDETVREGLTDREPDEPAEETKTTRRSADEEDESPTRGTKAKASSPLPSGRVPGDRACQLRRPPRLGPASFRRALCG